MRSAWVVSGLLALPAYGVLTAWSSLHPQPDQTTDPGAWAQFVSTDSYLVSHLLGSTGGTILAILGFFALGVYLARSRVRGLALTAMILTVAGQALLLIPAAISTFVTPAIGQLYLNGVTDVMQLQFPDSMTVAFMVGLLLAFVGNILFGVAMLRSRTVAKSAGAVWMIGTVTFYVLGVVLGQATTGSSLPTQSAGALLFALVAGWIVWGAVRQRPGNGNNSHAQPFADAKINA
ncbi:hypothetical protein ACX3O0_05970 [Homoserinimonas sp. A447]